MVSVATIARLPVLDWRRSNRRGAAASDLPPSHGVVLPIENQLSGAVIGSDVGGRRRWVHTALSGSASRGEVYGELPPNWRSIRIQEVFDSG